MRNFVLEELTDALDDRSAQFRYFFIVSTGKVEPYAADDATALHIAARPDALAIHPLSHAQTHELIADFIAT